MKNNCCKVALTLVTIIMFFFACKQELLLPEATKEDATSMEVETRASDVLKTVLGKKRTNPFTIENINKAYQIAFKTTKTLAPTHYYIKFKPNTAQELKVLIDTDLSLYDYPLDYEVKQMGEFYHDPAVPADKPTYLYGAVKISTTLPKVPYERLATLYLSTQNSTLTRKALELAGYNPDVEGYITDENETMPGTNVPSTDPIILPRLADPNGPLVRNANCDCKNGVQARNPAGCVRVQDTQLSTTDENTFKAVRQVKVIMKDTWFTEIEAQTNDAGCFVRSDKKFSGKAWVWVKFTNNKATFRMLGGAWTSVINYGFAVKDFVGRINGPTFNNIIVNYTHSSDIQAPAHRFWRAATAMNAVQEYHDFCNSNNLTLPPSRLNILSMNASGGDWGATAMCDKMGKVPFGKFWWAPVGLGTVCSALIAVRYTSVVGFYVSAAVTLVEVYLKTFAPDIVLNITRIAQFNSDRVKTIMYHELGHASHFSQVGIDYWFDNATYVVNNNFDYGNGTKPGADKCALIEMWGYYIESVISERAYGLRHSNTVSTDITNITNRKYINLMEGSFSLGGNANFIKSGLFHDISDINPQGNPYENSLLINSNTIPNQSKDKIGGFTPSQIFNIMTREVDTPIKFKNKFKTNRIKSNQTTDYDLLIKTYGF